MERLRVCVVAALASFASFVVAPPLSSQSSVIDIGRLGPESSFLWAVNNRNQAVGWSELAGSDTEHAILWQGGELIDSACCPGSRSAARSTSTTRGQIVGHAIEFDLITRGRFSGTTDGRSTSARLARRPAARPASTIAETSSASAPRRASCGAAAS